MKSERLLAATEETSALIARLDARISASVLAEAWQVRACFIAAERLAAVDGMPTRSGDILGLMMDAPLPVPASYRSATVGFGHWRRCMARIEFSELAEKLLGRRLSLQAAAIEAQEDWDLDDELPSAVRRSAGEGVDEIDGYARAVSGQAHRLDAPGPPASPLSGSHPKIIVARGHWSASGDAASAPGIEFPR